MSYTLKILPTALLEQYCERFDPNFEMLFQNLEDAEISTNTFSFYTSVASVFSSKIEGENIELDTYVKHKKFGVKLAPDYTKKIDDLYDAYLFGQQSAISKQNLEKAHALLTRYILAKSQQGKVRKQNMYVTTPDGRIEYVAAPPSEVETEMKKLYADIDVLITSELNLKEAFFFASMLHLVFVKIHPFNDGNGRTAHYWKNGF